MDIPGIRKMVKKDSTQVHSLLSEYLKKYPIHPELSLEEVKHMLIPREEIVDTYVVETDKKITDFVSFYIVPCSVFKHEKINEYKVILNNILGCLHLLLCNN